jgi:hypothetical protein
MSVGVSISASLGASIVAMELRPGEHQLQAKLQCKSMQTRRARISVMAGGVGCKNRA